MTVANAISEQFYLGDGVTTSFDFTYPVQAVTDLVVSVNGYAMTLGVDYSGVLLVGGASGARITFTAAPANGATVFLLRAPPVSQGFAFVAGMKIWEGTIGAVVDKLTMLVAKLSRRALVLSDTDPTTSPLVLPSKSVRAGTALGFDSNGNPTTLPVTPITSYAGLFSQINTWLAQQIFKTASDAFTATAGYSGGTTNARVLAVSGAAAAPGSTQDAAAVVQKSTASVATSGVNPAHYASIFKTVSGANTRATASYAEGQDSAGGAGSWVEAFRGYAGITAGALGSAFGGIFSGGVGAGVTYTYLFGVRAGVENFSGVDAPQWAIFDLSKYSAGFVASNNRTGVGNKSDVAFMTDPDSGAPFRTGFAVYGDDGAGRVGVDHTAFTTRGQLQIGLDFSRSTFVMTPLLLPNNNAIRIKNAALTTNLSVMIVDTSNQLILGADAVQTIIPTQLTVTGPSIAQVFVGSAPLTKTANYTVDSGATKDRTITFNGAASLTLTLPAAASWTGRRIRVRTIAAFTVVSASSNVVPLAGGAAGTAILAATAGKWADLESDGSNWIITAGN